MSKPSLREALSILELEGLVTVRRGRLGGADVRQPHSATAAYILGLVLQSNGATLRDVGVALIQMEPACAALCAARPDRERNVLPRLKRVHSDVVAAGDELIPFVAAARIFHEELVRLCGNKTLIEVVGVLERLWTAHEHQWAERTTVSGHFPREIDQKEGVHAHERILQLIESGDADRAARACRTHLEKSQRWALSGSDGGRISAKLLRRSEIF